MKMEKSKMANEKFLTRNVQRTNSESLTLVSGSAWFSWKTCLTRSTRIVSNNSLYKILFLLPLLKHFRLTYNGKRENWDLLLSHCRYFDKSFAAMFVEWSSAKHIILGNGNRNVKSAKKIFKNINFSEAIRGIKLKLCRIVYNISLYKTIVFLLPLLNDNLKFS